MIGYLPCRQVLVFQQYDDLAARRIRERLEHVIDRHFGLLLS
jgi:hypothetical protein